jgi:hypothetical protein
MRDEEYVTVKDVRDQLDKIQKWVDGIRNELSGKQANDRLSIDQHDSFVTLGPQPLARGCLSPSIRRPGDPGPLRSGSGGSIG